MITKSTYIFIFRLRKHTGKNAIQMALDRGMKDVATMLEQQAATLQFQAAQMEQDRQRSHEKARTGSTMTKTT